MLSDITLSSLFHLFAIQGAKSGVDVAQSEKLLNDYLLHHFGLRNTESYIQLYRDLRSFYDESGDMDTSGIVEQLCNGLIGKISRIELELMLLRLMEFSRMSTSQSFPEDMFLQISGHFAMAPELLQDYFAFVRGEENDNVRIRRFESVGGIIKTLWIPASNMMLFTYIGEEQVFFNDMPLLPGVFQIWPKSGILKNSKGAPLYYTEVHLPYETVSGGEISYIGKNVSFYFPGGRNGLHNMSFEIHSGELVAIMGGSGTGKTTLLSILNGTLERQEGELFVNGHSISEPCVKDLIGFVPQDDLLIDELTVYQNLFYTAKLCFGTLSDAEIDKKVLSVISDLDLEFAKDLVVGSPLNKTISGGQRKRVNIGLELIREPAILFLDEPTSGLSSADTEHVMDLLKEQTFKGKLIVVNIHQPSSDVFKLFDRLWLLDRGGYPVFDGNPIDAITWFKRAANYADAETSTCPLCGNVNPEMVMNIIDEKTLDNTGRPSSERKTQPQQWHEMYLAARKEPPMPESAGPIPDSGQKKPGRFRQFLIFLERNIKTKITNTQYIAITLLEAPVLALICGFLTHYCPSSGYTVMDNKNFVTYLFMAVIVAVFLGMSGSAEEIIKDRTILKRERFLNLSYGSYMFSKIVFCALVSLVQTALFIFFGNLVAGIHGVFLMWWAILFAASLLSSLIGLLLSQTLNSVVAIYITIPLLLIPQILLCGLVIPFNDLNPRSRTGNVPVVADIIPSRWAFEAMAVGTYCYNSYERPYNSIDRERYEALVLREAYATELEAAVARGDTAFAAGNLSRIEAASGLVFTGTPDAASLNAYIAEAKSALSRKGNELTLLKDRALTREIRNRGTDALVRLKRNSCNIQLENTVTGVNLPNQVEIVGDRLVPRSGIVYLTPSSRNGRAPFYSSIKILGNAVIPTFLYNLLVLLLMSAIMIAVLVLNLPERLKNDNNNKTKKK